MPTPHDDRPMFATGSWCQACGIQRPAQTVLGITDRELCWPCRWAHLRERNPRPTARRSPEPEGRRDRRKAYQLGREPDEKRLEHDGRR